MTPEQDLHTFARRFCMERHYAWISIYEPLARVGGDIRGFGYSPEAFAILPRYNVLRAIQREVEMLDFDDLPGFDELHELLIIAGKSAANDLTGNDRQNAISFDAEQEERELFVDAIRAAVADGTFEQTPLYYRRTLKKSEVDELWRRLCATWGMTGHFWYPIDSKCHPSLVALELGKIDKAVLQRRIKKFFKANDIRRIWQLREYGNENCCIDAHVDDLFYGPGGEGYWSSEASDWIVYCYEGTITLGGTIATIVTPDLNVYT